MPFLDPEKRKAWCRKCYKRKRKHDKAARKGQYAATKAWREKNQEAWRAQKLRIHGLTIETHRALIEKQRGQCAICGVVLEALPPKQRHIDHDHATGIVRGLLCHHCNSGLGSFRDNVENLTRAITYLINSRIV